MMWYGVLGTKELLHRTYKNLEQKVLLEVSGGPGPARLPLAFSSRSAAPSPQSLGEPGPGRIDRLMGTSSPSEEAGPARELCVCPVTSAVLLPISHPQSRAGCHPESARAVS